MVDFVKVWVPCSGHLLNNELLSFERRLNERTGEVKSYIEAEYDSLKFKLYDNGYLRLQGSLHKFFNGGLFNYDDFGQTDLEFTLRFLKESFQIDLDNARIQNFEFGLNIQVFSNLYELLSSLLLHKGIEPDVKYSSSFICFKHSEYSIKIYDKGRQNRLDHNCLRVEVKYNKSRLINQLNIHVLSDLFSKRWSINYTEDLISKWSQILMYEPFASSEIPSINWKLKSYWKSLSNVKRSRERKLLREWNKKGGDTQNTIAEILESKYQKLCM